RVGGTEAPVRWAEIASASGMRAHAGMQLYALTRGIRFAHESHPGVYDSGPQEGSLPAALAGPLAETLARHTSTPKRCWFAVWHGFGATLIRHPIRPDLSSAQPRLPPPGRSSRGRGREHARARARVSVAQPVVAGRSGMVRRHRDRPQHDLHRLQPATPG